MFTKIALSGMLLVQGISAKNQGSIFTFTSFSSNNSQSCIRDSIPHPAWDNHYVYLFRPAGIACPVPVVFFCHGINADNPVVYEAFINHMVGRGFAVVYSPYPACQAYLLPERSYEVLWSGFCGAAASWQQFLDMTNIGFVGHSYGAGAVPCMARKALVINGWGSQSAFLYMMAPWYMHGITQRQLRHFPRHVKVAVEVFADDRINDHRIGKDIFLSLGIADTSKVFCVLSSAAASTGQAADHDVPTGASEQSISVNDLDYCGVYFVFDALCAYTNNPEAGDARFRREDRKYLIKGPSGGFCKIETIRNPAMLRSQLICVNFWNHSMNPRRKLYRHIGKPLRLLVTTPETVVRYGNMALFAFGRRVINN